MKKTLLLLTIILAGSVILFQGCEKKDTTAPVITLTGDNPYFHTLNAAYVDPGATAKDDEDGMLTVDVDVSGLNVDLAGTYTVKYTAEDGAGNIGYKDRTVYVVNSALVYVGNYDVHDTKVVPGNPPIQSDYVEFVKASDSVNNRLEFSTFGNYENAVVYANINGTDLDIPQQEMTCGSPAKFRKFIGTGTVDTTQIIINYTETEDGVTKSGSGNYIKQQ